MTNKVKIRRNIHVNKTAFGKWVAEYNWSTLYRTVTCEDKLDIFMKVINTVSQGLQTRASSSGYVSS